MSSVLFNQAFAQSAPPPPGGEATTAQTQVPSGAPGAAAPRQPGIAEMLLPFGLMFLVVYFLMIRPQQKKLKEHVNLLDKIKYGDEIVTNAGFFGKVTGITDKVLTVEIADGVRVKMLKSQVASVNPNLATGKSPEQGA
ncbi:MAG: preprotein translocase subunit YajC [Bdellovibrionota bacterium]